MVRPAPEAPPPLLRVQADFQFPEKPRGCEGDPPPSKSAKIRLGFLIPPFLNKATEAMGGAGAYGTEPGLRRRKREGEKSPHCRTF